MLGVSVAKIIWLSHTFTLRTLLLAQDYSLQRSAKATDLKLSLVGELFHVDKQDVQEAKIPSPLLRKHSRLPQLLLDSPPHVILDKATVLQLHRPLASNLVLARMRVLVLVLALAGPFTLIQATPWGDSSSSHETARGNLTSDQHL